LRRRTTRIALTAVFVSAGAGFASWATRIPDVQDRLNLSSSELGLALLAVALGAFVTMPLAGWLSGRIGSARAVIASGALFFTALSVVALAPNLAVLATVGAFLGAGLGSLSVTMNAHGFALERLAQRPILSSFHAGFSAGGLAGAAVSALAAHASVDARVQLALVALAGLLLIAVTAPLLPFPEATASPPTRTFARPQRTLLVVSAVAFSCLLAEGAAADWSAVYLHRTLGSSTALAAIAYLAFSAAMTTGRVLGDGLTERLGVVRLARLDGLLALCGMGVAVAAPGPAAAILGYALLGLGLSTVVPLTFRAGAQAMPHAPALGVAAVSTLGWLGFLAGPPVIGLLAGAAGLRVGLLFVVVLVAAIAPAASLLAHGSPVAADDTAGRPAVAEG
jgi:MFS family permease